VQTVSGAASEQFYTDANAQMAHRVIYIITEATGSLSLYYDIELKDPLDTAATGGAMIPTTTIITKNRIYVPVPLVLEPAFEITAGAKEFYVRFDTIP
jgi:molecular chaperone HtpG